MGLFVFQTSGKVRSSYFWLTTTTVKELFMGNELVIGYSPSDFAKLRESLSFWKNRLQELEKLQSENPTAILDYLKSHRDEI